MDLLNIHVFRSCINRCYNIRKSAWHVVVLWLKKMFSRHYNFSTISTIDCSLKFLESKQFRSSIRESKNGLRSLKLDGLDPFS